MLLIRTLVKTAPGGLSHSSVLPVLGDQPKHVMATYLLVRLSPGGSEPIATLLAPALEGCVR